MKLTTKTKFTKLELNFDDIFKEIDEQELLRRKEAAKFAKKAMKNNVNSKGVSRSGGFPSRDKGNLFKSIKAKLIKSDRSAAIGTNSPIAHLLEFGHGDGKERNKRPFVNRSLLESENEIIKIMSEPYF